MADGEADRESGPGADVTTEIPRLEEKLQELESRLREERETEAVQAATEYCQRFCQTLLEYAEKWKASEDSLPLLEVYTVAIQSYAKARPYLTSECENVALVLERLTLSCVELLLCLPHELPDDHWEKLQSSIKTACMTLTENGSNELSLLYIISQEAGVWKDPVLVKIINQEPLDQYHEIDRFLVSEGPVLLQMRIKQLLKLSRVASATSLAKMCSDHPEISRKGHFKQLYLTCLCAASPNIKLIEEIAKVDCKDALDMICNLESEGDEKTSLILCAAFLSRQLQFGEMYCAWELTLFWSKLQRRVDPSIQVYLERCRQLSLLTKTVYHIFFLIKVIQSETEGAGLPTCIELCVRALRLESSENSKVKISICKTISCLLPDDLEVKRACQLTEFLLEPTVDAYYAVEMLYNQPDQKYDEESLPVPNSLRCELLLVLKTRWPFDPEFWDWKTLKRQCLALMGAEASIVSSIDELNDNEAYDHVEDFQEESKVISSNGLDCVDDTTNTKLVHSDAQKKKNIKKMREYGYISERFRNFQAYMQYCVLCDKEFLGHRIVRHAQKHCKDGIYSCPICAKQYSSKENFVPHVTLHVKQTCKERLATMKPLRRLGRPPKKEISCKNKKTVTVSKQERPIKKNSLYSDDFIVFNDNDNSDDDKDDQSQAANRDQQTLVNEFPCPVQFCNKGFKYFKNLIAHVRGHKDCEEATRFLEIQSKKVICQYCRRQFVSLTHLNDHLQMHCGSQPYICIQMKCKASFETYTELLTHRKEHGTFRARCMFPKCGRIFSAAYMLFDHEAQHYNTFTCKYSGCGKIYHSQLQLEKHLCEHVPEASLPESNTTAQLTEMPRTEQVASIEHSLPDCPMNSFLNAESLHSDNVTEPAVDKESNLPQEEQVQKVESPISEGLQQTVHLLDHLLPPPTDANLLSKMLPSSPVTVNQTLQNTEDILITSNLSGDSSSNVKIPSLTEEYPDILLNQSKIISTDNPNDTSESKQLTLDFEETRLPVFQDGKVSCPNQLSKDQDVSANSGENKLDVLPSNSVEGQVNSIMPYVVDNQTSQLCENNLDISAYEENSKPENTLSLSLETSTVLSNVLPPVSNSVATPVLPPQKFKCNVEGCTRIYNSVQSIGKHMKTAHPEHYDSFKTERKNRKKKGGISVMANPDDKPTYCILSGEDGYTSPVFPSQIQNGANSNFCNQLQHITNPVFPTHLENLVNPILSSVESIITHGLSKSVAESLLGTEVGNLTNSALTSQLEDLAKVVLPLKFENGSDPFLPMPTENDPLPVMSSLTGGAVFSQLGSSTNHDHVLAGGEAASSVFLKEETDAETFSKQGDGADMDASFNLDKSTSMLSNSGEKNAENIRPSRNREKKPKHGARAKCPAIIRDGKFICSRCFRVFTNPRSLGGHLSKRSVCKPHNEFDTSQVVQQSDSQASVLASMILSSSAKNNLQPPPLTFNPEISLKEDSLITSVPPDNRTTPFLQSGFSHTNVSNFTMSENKDEIREDVENQRINESGQGSLDVTSESCMPGTSEVNTTAPSTAVMPQILQSDTQLEDTSKMLNSDLNNSSNMTCISESNLLNTVENGLCSNTLLNSVEENNCISSSMNSSRVSVISGPQNSCLTESQAKGSGPRKKKKIVEATSATGASHELVKNILAAVGSLPPSMGGNPPMSSDLQQSFVTYGSDLIENIAKHLNSADKQLFLSCINESLKASSDSHTFSPLAVKAEESECLISPQYVSDKGQSELQIQTDFTSKDFDNLATEVFSVNNNNQSACSLSQSQNTVNDINIIPREMEDISVSSSLNTDNAMNIPICSISPTQEPEKKNDTQILEIMELVQKLQLVDDLPEDLQTNPLPPVDGLPSSVIVPNPSLNIADEQISDVSKALIDKCNAKPFVCQEAECSYCAMTKDALFKHYAKIHYYTQEKILEIKKHQLKFAPFRCVVPSCTKTFTRNSNLRAHCQSMHNFTSEQMVKLKIKRPYGRKPVGEGITLAVPEISHQILEGIPEIVPQVIPKVETCIDESHLVPQLNPKGEPEPCQEKQTLEAILPTNVPENTVPLVMATPASQILQALSEKIKKGAKVRKKKENELKQKKIQKVVKPVQMYSAYKPYRCVHQGCTAAFTIQQNLILHYQAVHKSDASKFSLEEEREECENGLTLKEFRCTETDCSRIFQEVASLIQHYMKLHEMIAEEIENILSCINIGQFKCDQAGCTSLFTTCSSYIEHLEEIHELKMKQVKLDGEEMFKCDCEGCNRVYATRSNLLRHIFNKHNDKHKEHLIRPRKISLSDQDTLDDKPTKEKPRVPKHKYDSEGIYVSKAKRYKGSLLVKGIKSGQGQMKQGALFLKYGRHTYSLKPRDVALAACTENLSKQYPCMVRGCTSIVSNEHNIIRHYKCHKLPRAFILKHRKSLIVCKRRVRVKVKTESSNIEPTEEVKSEVKEPIVPPPIESNPNLPDVTDESSLSTSQQSENEKDEMDELAALFISKLSNDESTGSDGQVRPSSYESSDFQETSSCQSEPQGGASNLKRAHKQKHAIQNRKRKIDTSEILSAETSSTVSGEENVTVLHTMEEPPPFDLSSFKPMGFEVSFLKFLEESASKQKKNTEQENVKTQTHTELQQSDKKIRLSVDEELSLESSDTDPYVLFSNLSHYPGMDNIKIILDQTFNDYIDLVIKQINELKPVVVLKRYEICLDESTSVSKEQMLDVDKEHTV
ncbi:zinc finger protein 292 [Rhinophrynus dorsalis]